MDYTLFYFPGNANLAPGGIPPLLHGGETAFKTAAILPQMLGRWFRTACP
ncbi:hypothetical protein [Nitrospirillum pindoramense]|uniref:Uncharacterized protein n=1 Tax=Nitrospirillum amazonense TaxID=28077 RepID=A0A560H6E5_9PROT|nr:hypothetical protein [Nitrospirillum amazonense]TWB41875.1 hypothetical protein FBZ90_107251 [Nitrospirillum amazonense]